MSLTSFPFDLKTGELLPRQREAYLRGQLSPVAALAVEKYLDNNPVQTGIVLACWHELVASEKKSGRPLLGPTLWVKEQLRKQPSVSKLGPLRRPVIQFAVLVLLVLGVTSGVQWARQKPLIPEPVTAAVQQITQSVSETTESITSSFDSQETRQMKEVVRRQREAAEQLQSELARLRQEKEEAVRTAQRAIAEAKRPIAIDPLTSTAPQSVTEVATTENTSPQAEQVRPQSEVLASARAASGSNLTVVRGHIVNEEGSPLAGATVLVQGTRHGTSTNSNGEYILEAPAGALLQFGYAGYADQVVKTGVGAADVTLEPVRQKRRIQ